MSQVVENNGTEVGEVKKDNKSNGAGFWLVTPPVFKATL